MCGFRSVPSQAHQNTDCLQVLNLNSNRSFARNCQRSPITYSKSRTKFPQCAEHRSHINPTPTPSQLPTSHLPPRHPSPGVINAPWTRPPSPGPLKHPPLRSPQTSDLPIVPLSHPRLRPPFSPNRVNPSGQINITLAPTDLA